MGDFLLNLVISSTLLTTVIFISKTNPILGGFLISLPLSTLIVLALSKLQGLDTGNTFLLAKSIMVGVPSTLLFFVPFLIADKFKLSFWSCYFIGFALLLLSYVIHKWIVGIYWP